MPFESVPAAVGVRFRKLVSRPYNRRQAQRDFLSRCPLFSALPPAQLDTLCAASRLIELPARASIHASGDAVREAFLLCAGSVVRFRPLGEGDRQIIELVQEPQVLALGEVFGARRYESSCETASAAVVLALELPVLLQLVQQDAGLAKRVIETLARRQCAIEFDVTGHRSGQTGAQRILDYLIGLAGGSLPLAGETTVELKTQKKVLAGRLGITPEAFSRSLHELSDKGVIVVNKSRIHIQNAALLDTGSTEGDRRLSFARKLRTPRDGAPRQMPPGELVNLCGRLRLLSQRQAVAWALMAHGVSPADARAKLRQRIGEFERVLSQLQGARLVPELDGALEALACAWSTYKAALAVNASEPGAGEVLAASERFLEAADALTALAERMAGVQLAHYVNVAGRNRMLSQRIVKFFFFSDIAACAEEAGARIAASAREFEANLAELRDSGQALPELLAQLDAVAEQWQRLNVALAPGVAYTRRAQHVRAVLGEGRRLMRYVDTAVTLYERLTR